MEISLEKCKSLLSDRSQQNLTCTAETDLGLTDLLHLEMNIVYLSNQTSQTVRLSGVQLIFCFSSGINTVLSDQD